MAEPDELLDGDELQVDVEVRRVNDDTFGVVFTTNPTAPPDQSKGFWLQMDREGLEDLVEKCCQALDQPTRLKTTAEAVQDLGAIAAEEKDRRRKLN